MAVETEVGEKATGKAGVVMVAMAGTVVDEVPTFMEVVVATEAAVDGMATPELISPSSPSSSADSTLSRFGKPSSLGTLQQQHLPSESSTSSMRQFIRTLCMWMISLSFALTSWYWTKSVIRT